MKIVSKFKDYYDGVQSFGIDHNVIYHRVTTHVDIPKEGRFAEIFNEYVEYDQSTSLRSRSGFDHCYIIKGIIGFCGKLLIWYALVEFIDKQALPPRFYYSKKDLVEYLLSREKDLRLEDLKYDIGVPRKSLHRFTWSDAIKELIQPHPDRSFHELFHTLGQPIFLYPAYVFSLDRFKLLWPGRSFQGQDIILNPPLHALNFQKIKDAFQCYQDIDQYLNGVLGSTEDSSDKRSDIEKVRSHGFDEKYGFRKRKDT